MSQYLFKVQQHNRLEQKGLLKRFSVDCYGHQETLEEIRAKKNKLFLSLKNKKNTKEYEMHFMKYRPIDQNTPSSIVTTKSFNKSSTKSFKSSTKSFKRSTKPMSRKRGRGGLFI